MNNNIKYVVGFAAALALVVLGGLAYMYSGAFNAAASAPHGAVDRWVLQTTMQRSVRTRADERAAPERFTAEQVAAGFREFDSECAMCHGAPGVERQAWAQGMQPAPPNLAQSAERWSRAELFWIIKNGVKMTGMPAMGSHHSDEDIWSIVAFIETLPEMSPGEYAQMRGEADPEAPSARTHSHRH